jgi:hypothetical protein
MVLNHNMSAFDKKLTYIIGENNVVLQAHCNTCGNSTHRYKAGKGCNVGSCITCRKKMSASPKYRADVNTRRKTEEYRKKARAYEGTPARVLKRAEYNKTPLVIAKNKLQAKKPSSRRQQRVYRNKPNIKDRETLRASTPEAKKSRKNRRSTPEKRLATFEYNHRDDVKAKRKVHSKTAKSIAQRKAYSKTAKSIAQKKTYSKTSPAIAQRKAYTSTDSHKKSKRIAYALNRHKSVTYLECLALNNDAFNFLGKVNQSRLDAGKSQLKNEYLYQHIIYHSIMSLGVECKLEHMNDKKTDVYDVILPREKMIIETKVASTGWNKLSIDSQLERYRKNNPDFQVIGTAPKGEYGLLNFKELMAVIKMRLS